MNGLVRRRLIAIVAILAVFVVASLLGARDDDGSDVFAPPATDVSTGPSLPPTPEAPDVDAVLPTAASAGAHSSTWFCVGGSGAPDGPAPATLEIANRGTKPTTATLTAVGSDGTSTRKQVELGAASRTELALADLLPAPTTSVVVESRGGDVTVGQRFDAELGAGVVPCSSRAATQWYFAGGSTDRGAVDQLVVYNPFPDPATVDVTYYLADGLRRPEKAQGIPLAGGSSVVVKVNDTQDRVASIGAAVTTRTGRVIAARVQSFDGTGEPGPTGQPAKGLAVSLGSPWASRAFVLPDGAMGDGTATQLVLTNPGPEDSTVRLDLQVDQPDVNGQPTPITVEVPANSWKILGPAELRQLPPGVPFSVRGQVTLGGPVVAEAWRFANEPATAVGVSIVAGVPVSATDWVFPVAVPGGVVDRLSIVSTGTAATISLAASVDGKRIPLRLPATGVHGVGANGRASIDLAPLLAEHPGALLVVHADQPVVVARSWFGVDGKGLQVLTADPLAGTTSLL